MQTITYKGAVHPWHCDHMGHMNVMWYVGKFDEATWLLFAAFGLTPAYFRERNRGMAAVQQNISYRRELLAGDIVEVRSRVLEAREYVDCTKQLAAGRAALDGLNKAIKAGDLGAARTLTFDQAVKLGSSNGTKKTDMPAQEAAE